MSENSEILQEARHLIQAGRFVEAERSLMALVAGRPQTADAWFLLGAARHQSGNAEGALAAFDETCRLDPTHARALSARAAVLFDLGRGEEAATAYGELARANPGDPQSSTNLGIVLEGLGRREEALAAYRQALARSPDYSPALNNCALVLSALGRVDEALEAYRELLARHPENADYHFNCAELLHGMGRMEDSVAAARQALEIDPRHVNALIQQSLNYAVLGRFDDANRCLDQARRIDPRKFKAFRNPYDTAFADNDKGLEPRLVYLDYLYGLQSVCDWSRHGEYVEKFAALIAAGLEEGNEIVDPRLPFRSLAFPMPEAVRAGLAASIARGVAAAAGIPRNRVPKRRIAKAARIRLGYVSPDFRIHPAAYLVQPVLELHDRSRLEVYAYSLTASDDSEIRHRVEASVDVFREESGSSDAAIAERIAADRIDVLVDLAGYTSFSRAGVFARRPGALQVSYLGFVGTLGADWIDYAIVDHEVCPAGAERHWVEKLAYLPDTYFIGSFRDRIDALPSSRASSGLPEAAFVLCCFNNAHKIEPVMFSIWMRALLAAPDAVLWLFSTDPRIEENLRREAAARGVDPGRLIFAPYWAHDRHLGRLVHADLMVDTLYFNAHTTAVDALGAGVPLLTYAGPSMASRVGSSILKAMGLPELVTTSLAEYEDRLLYFVRNRAEAERMRAKVRANYGSTPLFDTARITRHLESAYRTMVERQRAGLPPASFDVAPVAGSTDGNR